MSQETLAERAGLSLSSISAYERGSTDPSLEALQRLSDALGVPRGMLVDVDPSGEPALWAAFLRASDSQRRDMSRAFEAVVAPRDARK